MNAAAMRSRLTHAMATLLVVAALAMLGVSVISALLFVTGLDFFGGAAGDASRFVGRLAPIAYFAGGALIAGGAIALLNAIVAPKPHWLVSIFAAAVVGGLAAAWVPAVGHALINVAMPIFAMVREVGKMPQRKDERRLAAAARDEERWRAGVFAVTQDKVQEASGGTYKTTVVTPVELNGVPVRYVVSVAGDKTVYAIVDVSRSGKSVEFKLACLRQRDPGPLEPLENPCQP
jgi:hypothetical protein